MFPSSMSHPNIWLSASFGIFLNNGAGDSSNDGSIDGFLMRLDAEIALFEAYEAAFRLQLQALQSSVGLMDEGSTP